MCDIELTAIFMYVFGVLALLSLIGWGVLLFRLMLDHTLQVKRVKRATKEEPDLLVNECKPGFMLRLMPIVAGLLAIALIFILMNNGM